MTHSRKSLILRLTIVAGAASISSSALALGFSVTWGTGAQAFSADQQATVQQALNDIAFRFTDNVTVNLTINKMTSGLGQSSTALVGVSYSQFKTALTADKTTALDTVAVANLAASMPYHKTTGADKDVTLSKAQARALGFSTSSGNDCTIGLNAGICFTRSQGAQSGLYDLHAVAEHEIDEAMGFGGPGSAINGPNEANYVGSQDLFRFTGNGVRSTLSHNSVGNYLSYDNGATNIRSFNNGSGGGDYADWASDGNAYVQNAFGTPGVLINYSDKEIAAGDGIGWDAAQAVPEPCTMTLLGLGVAAFIRRKKA